VGEKVYSDVSFFTNEDSYFFKEGTHFRLYHKLGAHPTRRGEEQGTYFAVWAPNAQMVTVMGDFNRWDRQSHKLHPRGDGSGIWEGFIPGIGPKNLYKYFILSKFNNYSVEKMDPFALCYETPPKTASIIWELDYEWHDDAWMKKRKQTNSQQSPFAIYEIHLGSWRRVVEEGNRYLNYQELAEQLVQYVKDMRFTHVELLPIMEHPFYGSWGYQTLGYFAPTNRYGSPQELMGLIDTFHQNDIGVILDWVPSHFPADGHGLSYFDGTCLYEHADPQKGFHPDWKCYIFNNGRNEVKEFLISNALFWFDKYHVDGLRVDAVASMLYLDYSRKEGEWSPNIYGGRDNIESIAFIKQLNTVVYENYPDVQMVAEESTAWGMVSRPVHDGGLGFGMKWNMGWMHDTLEYFRKDPIYRKHHHNELTFSMLYAFTENFVLSLSHDEVVHGKGSLIGKMPCDDWQKFANLRLLFGYMFGHVGKKLLFMGSEFAQRAEWNHDQSLDWHLLQYSPHQGIQRWVKDLNHFYKNHPVLYRYDFEPRGFEWIDCHDWQQSILSFIRRGDSPMDTLLVVCNFTPTPRHKYRVAVPTAGRWQEVLNSDSAIYGGSGMRNPNGMPTESVACQGRSQSILVNLPPLSVIFLQNMTVKEDEIKYNMQGKMGIPNGANQTETT
jgi:1,4-alpha-glucan branching enzyme